MQQRKQRCLKCSFKERNVSLFCIRFARFLDGQLVKPFFLFGVETGEAMSSHWKAIAYGQAEDMWWPSHGGFVAAYLRPTSMEAACGGVATVPLEGTRCLRGTPDQWPWVVFLFFASAGDEQKVLVVMMRRMKGISFFREPQGFKGQPISAITWNHRSEAHGFHLVWMWNKS